MKTQAPCKALFKVTQMKAEEEKRWATVDTLLKRHESELKSLLSDRTDFMEVNSVLERHQQEMDEAVVSLIENSKTK